MSCLHRGSSFPQVPRLDRRRLPRLRFAALWLVAILLGALGSQATAQDVPGAPGSLPGIEEELSKVEYENLKGLAAILSPEDGAELVAGRSHELRGVWALMPCEQAGWTFRRLGTGGAPSSGFAKADGSLQKARPVEKGGVGPAGPDAVGCTVHHTFATQGTYEVTFVEKATIRVEVVPSVELLQPPDGAVLHPLYCPIAEGVVRTAARPIATMEVRYRIGEQWSPWQFLRAGVSASGPGRWRVASREICSGSPAGAGSAMVRLRAKDRSGLDAADVHQVGLAAVGPPPFDPSRQP